MAAAIRRTVSSVTCCTVADGCRQRAGRLLQRAEHAADGAVELADRLVDRLPAGRTGVAHALQIEGRGGGEIEEDRLRQHVDAVGELGGREAILAPPARRSRSATRRRRSSCARGPRSPARLPRRWCCGSSSGSAGRNPPAAFPGIAGSRCGGIRCRSCHRPRPPAAAGRRRQSPRRRRGRDAVRATARSLAESRAPGRRSCSSRAGRPTPGRRGAASSTANHG